MKTKLKNYKLLIILSIIILLVLALIFYIFYKTVIFADTDDWDKVIKSVNDGTYKEKYNIGDTMELDLGPEGIIEMEIIAFDTDELADKKGKASITWISKQLIKSEHLMNPYREKDASDPSEFQTGTGSIGGWKDSEMRKWLKSDIKGLIPQNVRDAIKPVKKYSTSYNTSDVTKDEGYIHNEKSVDDIWIPSWREVFGSDPEYSSMYDYFESKGPTYSLFTSDDDRIKKEIDADKASWWWLRSAGNNSYYDGSMGFNCVFSGGSDGYYLADNKEAVAIGFCM